MKSVNSSAHKCILVACFYGGISLSIAFINKTMLTYYHFNFPFFLITLQMLFTIVVLESLRLTKIVDTLPRITWERSRLFLLPSLFYGTHCILTLSALSGMNITMYGVVKRCGPLATMFLGVFLFGREFPNISTFAGIVTLTIGCIIAGYGDLSFDAYSYCYGVISVFTQAIYLLLTQKSTYSLSALEILHLNSFNTFTPLLLFSLLTGQMKDALRMLSELPYKPLYHISGFITVLILTISIGSLLNYSIFLCTSINSALTTSVVGVVKGIMQTIIGFFVFGGVTINKMTISGIITNLLGAILYTYSKFKLQQSVDLNVDKSNCQTISLNVDESQYKEDSTLKS